MSTYVLSDAANSDLQDIVTYTYSTWGLNQTRRYRQKLSDGFSQLAVMPGMGKNTRGLAPGIKSFAVEHHTVFYTEAPHGITIVRILHERRLPHRGLFLVP